MPLTHCDVMLQHKYFHTHYSTTGNVTDTIIITHTLPQWMFCKNTGTLHTLGKVLRYTTP